MDPGDQGIRIQAPTPRASLVTPTPSESQPSLLNPISAATSTLFTSSPIQQNVPLSAANVGNPASDAHTELNQQAHDYEAVDPYIVSLKLQRRQLGNLKTHDFWIVATRIFFPQIYLHFNLCLPWLYWARVGRIFRDAAQAIEELEAQLEQGSLKNDTVDDAASARGINHQINIQTRRPPQRSNTVYSYNDQTEGPDDTVIGMKLVSEDGITKLKRNWELFIDSLLREWKTLNLVSVLLLSAIIAILQVDAASADFAIRTPALGSAICALMSLLYGCIYTIRFFDMKKVHRAMEWSKKAKQSALNPYWNPWVFLSLPVVWLTWSIMLFTTAIMTYVWRTDGRSGEDYQPISPHLILASRLVLTAIFVFGLVHLFLAIWTLVEWDYAKLDNNFRATVNKNKGEVNKTTLVNAGMNLHTGGTLTTDPLSYPSASPLSNAEAPTSSGGRSSTPTNESQTIYMSGPAGGSTLALPTIPILSTRLGTFFLSFIPTAWLNDNRTHNLGRLVDPNRTTAQTPRPVVAGSSTSASRSPLPASLARRVSRVRTPVPEPPIPEETENAEASTRTFSTQKISKIFRSVPRDIDAVELETLSRSLFEKGAPPDPRSQEERNRVEQLEDLGAIGATDLTDLTESNKSELVDNGPLQSEATHAGSIVASKAKSDDSVAQTAMQGVADIPEMGIPLPGPSRTHAKEISQNLKTTQFGDSVARTPVLRIVNVSSFGDMSSSGSELSLVHDFTPGKEISQTQKKTLGADLLQDHEATSKAEVENDYEEISTASAPFEKPSIENPIGLVISTTAALQKYLAEQQASLISRHRERSIIRLYHLYDEGQKPDIPPELVEDTPGILQTRSQLSGRPTNDYQRDAWDGLLLRDEIRDPALDVQILQEDNVLTQSPEKDVLSTETKTRPDDITWTKARREFYSLSKLPHEEMVGPMLPQVLAGDSERTHNGFVHPPIYLKNVNGTLGLPLGQVKVEWTRNAMLPKEGYFLVQWPTNKLPSLINQVTYLLNNPFHRLVRYYPWAMAPFESTMAEERLGALLLSLKAGAKPQILNRVDVCWQWPDYLYLSNDFLLVSLHHIGFASDGKEVWQPQFRLTNPVPNFWFERNPIASVQTWTATILSDSSEPAPIELPKKSSISADRVPFFYYTSRVLVKSYAMTLDSVSVCLPQICNVPVALRRNRTGLSVPLFFKDENGQYGVPLSQIQLPQPMPSGYIIIHLPDVEGNAHRGYASAPEDTKMQEFPLRDLVPWGNAPCDWLPLQIRSNPNIATAIQNLFNTVYEKVKYPITHPDGSRITASDLKIFSLHHVGYISGRWQVWQPDFVLSTKLARGNNFAMWRVTEMQYIHEKQNGPERGRRSDVSVELGVYFKRAGVRAVYDLDRI